MPEAPKLKGLYHYAYPCRDAEETRHFYEDILGLPLVNCMLADKVPSTGEEKPYAHFFFEMGDGSYIAFFDLGDDVAALPSPNTPAWVNHIALRVDSVEDLLAAKARLEAAGVEVLGVTDHHIIESIYFFDPNGIRLELTTPTVPQAEMDAHAKRARADLDAWTGRKAQLRAAKGGTNA